MLLRVSEATFVTAAALLSVTSGHLMATIAAVLGYDAMSAVYVYVVRSRGFPLGPLSSLLAPSFITMRRFGYCWRR